MLNRTFILLSSAIVFAACNNNSKVQETQTEKDSSANSIVWTQVGFTHPESIAYYENENCLFVSNIGNDDAVANGFISKLALETGEIIQLKWCDSLFSPKGIAISKSALYVADLKYLCKIDIASGKILNKYTAPEVGMFNDIAINAKGEVFVSDMVTSSIYKLDTLGVLSSIYQNDSLHHPNGLLCKGNKLFIGGWGRLDDSKTEQDSVGTFWELQLETLELKAISKTKLGKLDGIQSNGDSLMVSSWKAGELFTITPDGRYNFLLKTEESVGDFLYLEKEKKMYLPLNFQNKVVVHNVE
ncbi:MAG: hypothetical protein IPO21_07930 [Bacteroidales bacterium]|nr:hypothetical protein [Bacteroidales bacterium]